LLADCAGGGKRGVVLHVDHELVAVEERVRVLADPAGELRLSHVRGLRLSGQDIAARLGDGVVKLASGEEHERGLNEGHEKRAKMAPPPGRIRRLRRRYRNDHGARALWLCSMPKLLGIGYSDRQDRRRFDRTAAILGQQSFPSY
jgi:hypothetical protein